MESLVIWGLCLLAASLLLVVVEVFVPSGGLLSLVSAVLAISGLVCLFRHDWVWGLSGTLAMLVLAPMVFFAGINIMPSTPMGKKLLYGEGGKDEAVESLASHDALSPLVGHTGKAVTDLRPVGTVQIDAGKHSGQRVQARSEISLVPAGSRVRITGVDGPVVTVRPLA